MQELKNDDLDPIKGEMDQIPMTSEMAAEEQTTVAEDVHEIESDEQDHPDAFAHEAKEMKDYAHMGIKELILDAKQLIDNNPVTEIKDEIESIKNSVIHQLDEIKAEKLHEFIEQGGFEIDFQYEQPERRVIFELYNEYRNKRNEHYKELQAQLNLNLEVKKAIIEAIKELPQKDAPTSEIHKELHELQDRWKHTGPVPRAESTELWNNYHFHLDNYYKFLQISNELRELDFKKNLEAKEALCIDAEALDAEADLNVAFKILQGLHAKWKLTGPVDREHREPIWERFSEASKKIHDKRHEHFESLRETREAQLAMKKDIIEQLKAIDTASLTSHSQWQKAQEAVHALRENYKQVGRVNLPENDVLWAAFGEANKVFNHAKNTFYRALKAVHAENLQRKQALLDRAYALKESDNWREATQEFKRLQEDWKKIGFANRADGEKIWQEFRAACNHFFERLTDKNKAADAEFIGNLEAKKALLEKVKAFVPDAENAKKSAQEVKDFIGEWRKIGRVPGTERNIETEFNTLIDSLFSSLKMNQRESNMIRFENKISSMAETDKRQLNREEDILQRKIDEAVKDLQQQENNIGFFAHVDEKNPILREAKKKIEKQQEEIQLLKDKLKMLRKLNRES